MTTPIDRRRFLQATTASLALGGAPAMAAQRRRVSSKKGCCFVAREDSPWLERTTALNAKWLYTWGSNLPEGLPEGVEFCPMIWGGSSKEKLAKHIEKLKPLVESGRVQHLMGFNEPDQHDQSNMSVEKVVELWPVLMQLGVPLVSPGCVHPDREWMYKFMEQVEKKKLRVDFIAVHSYGGPSAPALLNRLEKVSRTFGRPVWITEFAVGDWQASSVEEHRHPPKQVAQFMRQVLPALEAAPFVDRYAWFSAGQKSKSLGTSALFDQEGELTPLGQLYAKA